MRSIYFLFVICILFKFNVAFSQTFSAENPILQKIWQEENSHSKLPSLAQVLDDSLGSRLTGSPSLKAAQNWVVAKYTNWGISARIENYGTWKGWKRGITHIDLLEPRIRSLEGTMLAWSAATKGAVVATTIILPDLDDSAAYEAWFSKTKGKFVMVSPLQSTCRTDTNWRGFATPESYDKMQKERSTSEDNWKKRIKKTGLTTEKLFLMLEKNGALGIINCLWTRGWGVNRIFGVSNERIPVVTLSCEDYGLVYRLTENDQHPKISIETQSTYLGEVPVGNVIAEIKGQQKPEEYVMLSAHFDSWDGSSGATDNGTGTIVMMEAMRILKEVYPSPKRTILAGHWSGEEQGLNGSRAFSEDHPLVLKGMQALFNQDNGTGRIEKIGTQGLLNAGGFIARLLEKLPTEISKNLSIVFSSMPAGGGSDNASFICHGVPAFGLSSLNWDYFSYTWHTNRDTYDKLVFDDLRSNAILVAMLVYLACEEPELLSRERRTVFPLNTQTGKLEKWPDCVPAKRSFKSSSTPVQ